MKRWWCKKFHGEITRPVNGEYTCLTCLRRYPVPWEINLADQETAKRWALRSAAGCSLEEAAAAERNQ